MRKKQKTIFILQATKIKKFPQKLITSLIVSKNTITSQNMMIKLKTNMINVMT